MIRHFPHTFNNNRIAVSKINTQFEPLDMPSNRRMDELIKKKREHRLTEEELFELDVLYLQLNFRDKHKRLFPSLKNKYGNNPMLYFIQALNENFYGEDKKKILYNLKKAKQFGLNTAHFYHMYGVFFMKINNIDLAKKCFNQALKIDCAFSSSLNNLAVISWRNKDFRKCEEYMFKILYYDQEYHGCYFILGDVYKSLYDGGVFKGLELRYITLLMNPRDTNIMSNVSILELGYSELKRFYSLPLKVRKNARDILVSLLREKKRIYPTFNEFYGHKEEIYEGLIHFSHTQFLINIVTN